MRAMLMLNCDHSQKAYFGITYQQIRGMPFWSILLLLATHRRAGSLRPSPSVPVRGLRCGGVCGRERGGRGGWGEREG